MLPHTPSNNLGHLPFTRKCKVGCEALSSLRSKGVIETCGLTMRAKIETLLWKKITILPVAIYAKSR